MDVRLHPLFQDWLDKISAQGETNDVDWFEVFAEVMALIAALEQYGRELGDPECHPIVTASYDLHALRRTPPTASTPYADRPPVLRIVFGFVRNNEGQEIAVIAVGGDKTSHGNRWYRPNVTRAQDRIDQWCQQNPTYKPIIKRGGIR